MDHLTLEHEIAAELNPPLLAATSATACTARRETVLSMLSQSAQLAQTCVELINEAGFLAAAVLELDLFGGVEILSKDAAQVSIGSVAGMASNVVPDLYQIPWGSPRSAFRFAVEAGRPIVIADLPSENRFEDLVLTRHNVRSGVICPVSYRDENFGALGCFSTQPRTFDRSDALFLQSFALFLGPTRAHQKAQQALAEHSRFLSSAIDSLDAIVLLLDSEGGVLQINRGCQSLGGFTLPELRGRRFWSAFWQPEECSAAEGVISELRGGAKQVKREAFFLTKLGVTRRVAWTFTSLQESHGLGPSILATGIDITEQHNAVNRLKDTGHTPKPSRPAPATERAAADFPSPAAEEQAPAKTLQTEESGRERRVHDRRPYQCIQMVAPCLDGRLPDLEQFREVRCFDISPRGFSFLLSTRPTFQELVATFGSATSRLYLRALIRHITPIQFEGRKVLLIGCEYLGRVRISSASS